MSTLLSIGAAALVSLLVLRWKRDELDQESRDALAREEVRHRASLARWIIGATVASLGIGVALPVASLGLVTYGVVRMSQQEQQPTEVVASFEMTMERHWLIGRANSVDGIMIDDDERADADALVAAGFAEWRGDALFPTSAGIKADDHFISGDP